MKNNSNTKIENTDQECEIKAIVEGRNVDYSKYKKASAIKSTNDNSLVIPGFNELRALVKEKIEILLTKAG